MRYRVTFPGNREAVYEDGQWAGDPLVVDIARASETIAAGRLRQRGGYVPDYSAALAAEVAALGGGTMALDGEPEPAPPGRVY